MALASIVVVNYNGRRHLPGLFASLACQTLPDFRLIFVDNNSHDDSLASVGQLSRAYGLSVTLIANPSNFGFAATCNQGLQASDEPWLVLLNNDTLPASTWLETLVATAEGRPEVGMVASKMLFAERPDRINSAGIALDRAGIAWDWRGGEADRPQETEVVEVFGPCGGAALYARRMLEQIGGFDEDFFMYLEDVDLAWRARLAGWQCLLQPRARVLHAHSATAGEGSPFKSYLLARNKVWLLAKNYPQPYLARTFPAVVGYDAAAALYGWVKRGDAASIRGRAAGLRRLQEFLAKRRTVQERWRDVENWARLVAPLEPPWAVARRYAHLG